MLPSSLAVGVYGCFTLEGNGSLCMRLRVRTEYAYPPNTHSEHLKDIQVALVLDHAAPERITCRRVKESSGDFYGDASIAGGEGVGVASEGDQDVPALWHWDENKKTLSLSGLPTDECTVEIEIK